MTAPAGLRSGTADSRRTLVGLAVLGAAAAVAILALLAVVIGIRLFTDIALVGWTSQVIGILVILMAQLLITVILMALLVVSRRSQIPSVPATIYKVFVYETRPL